MGGGSVHDLVKGESESDSDSRLSQTLSRKHAERAGGKAAEAQLYEGHCIDGAYRNRMAWHDKTWHGMAEVCLAGPFLTREQTMVDETTTKSAPSGWVGWFFATRKRALLFGAGVWSQVAISIRLVDVDLVEEHVSRG